MAKVKGLGRDEQETECKVVKRESLGKMGKVCIECGMQQGMNGGKVTAVRVGSSVDVGTFPKLELGVVRACY